MATVVAKTHPFREKLEHWEVAAGTTIAEVLKKLSAMFRHLPITVQVNGRPIKKAKWISHQVKESDLINIRVCPASGKAGMGIVGAGIGIGGLLLARMLSKNSSSKASEPATSNNDIAPPPDAAPAPSPVPVDGFGGYKDVVMPQLTGVTNQANPYGAIPRVYGTYRINPVIVAQPYYTTQGGAQYMHVVFCCGYGKLDVSDIKIGLVPIGDYVSQGVLTYEVLTGASPDSEAVSIYTNDVQQTNVGSELVYTVPQNVLADQQSDTLSVDITFPNGLYAVDKPTKTLHSGLSNITIVGDMEATEYYRNVQASCSFTIKYRPYSADGSGSWTTRSLTATANQPGTYRVSDTWSAARGLYEVQITKNTSDSRVDFDEEIPPIQLTTTTTQLGFTLHHKQTPVNTAVWSAVKAIKNAAPINKLKDKNGDTIPLTYIAVKVKASALLNGTLDNLSCLCKSYLRTWNGSSWDAPAITANPAWVLADMVTGTAYNKQLDDTYIDKNQLKAWADFCDSKGFTFNDSIDDFTTLADVLTRVTTCGRASINVIDGLISVFYDAPQETVSALFTPANTSSLTIERQIRKQPHAIKVNFINPDADWQQDTRTVYADGYNINNAIIFETFDYRGVTNAAQAYKLARYHMAAALLRPHRYTLSMDWINLVCNRGDRVQLNYDTALYGLSSALIDEVIDDGDFVTSLRLNQSVYFDPSKTYGIKIQYGDGTITRYLLEDDDGWTDTVTFAEPISLLDDPLPERNDTIAFGFYNDEAQDMIVTEIRHNAADRSATLTLARYSPEIFDADTGSIPDYSPNVSIQHPARKTLETPVIDSVKSDESVLVRTSTGALVSQIQLTLQPPVNTTAISSVETQFRLTGETLWQIGASAPLSGASVAYVSGVVDGEYYDVQVRYTGLFGVTSEWAQVLSHKVVGKTTLPPDVVSFRLQGIHAVVDYSTQGGVAVPLDFAGFEVRWAQGTTATWEQMLILTELSTSPIFDISKLPKGALVLAVKAVDTSGNRSENACFLYRNINSVYIQNIIEEVDYGPDWDGTIVNASVSGSDLVADDSGDIFWGASGGAFWRPDPSSLFWDPAYLSLQFEKDIVPPAVEDTKPYRIFFNAEDESGNSLIEGDTYFFEYAHRWATTPFWDNPDTPFYGDSGDLFWNIPPSSTQWIPVPQEGLAGTRELIGTRITSITNSPTQPKLLNGISVIYDLPDLEEEVDQVISANGGAGTALTLSKTYTQIRQVQLTIQHNDAYPTVVSATVDKSVIPPVVRCLDNTGTVVDGEISAIVRGY